MRIDYGEDELISNRGFLLLKGKKRTWFFIVFVKGGDPFVMIESWTSEIFQQEMRVLL